MPIYEYRCGKCGFQKEILQRLTDAPLAVCPECGKRAMQKMVTAAGFQLKGTGWYATDFKSGGAKPDKADAKADGKADKPAAGDKPAEKAGKDASKPAPAAAADAPAKSSADAPAN